MGGRVAAVERRAGDLTAREAEIFDFAVRRAGDEAVLDGLSCHAAAART